MPHNQPYAAIVPAPFGAVGIRMADGALAGVDFMQNSLPLDSPPDSLAAEAAHQVAQYFAQPGFRFDLPLPLAGTEFQRRVWQEIAAIPPGRTSSYAQIAVRIGSAPRAVGRACGANPFPLLTPCHRVVTASGGLGGFSGRAEATFLLDVKRWLLAHEGVLF